MLASTRTHAVLLAGLLALLPTGEATAQGLIDGRHQPVDRRMPMGVPSSWVARTGGLVPGYRQPVRIESPGGTVTVYSGSPARSETADAPVQASLTVGHVYRFRIADLPNHPGVELYPTVELIGHLHPPRGRKDDFPVRIPIDDLEVDLVLQGRMITKVIYLEQPQLASNTSAGAEVEVFDVSPRINVVHEADRRGRPVAILRMGGRLPDPRRPSPSFFGTPPAIEASVPNPRPDPAPRTRPYADPADAPPGLGPEAVPMGDDEPPATSLDELQRQGWRLPADRTSR